MSTLCGTTPVGHLLIILSVYGSAYVQVSFILTIVPKHVSGDADWVSQGEDFKCFI